MTPEDFAQAWNVDLDMADAERDRSVQSTDRTLGVSDVMHCRSYAARFLNGDPFTDAPSTAAATRGTWLHAGVLPAIASQRPGVLVEQEVKVELPNGITLPGHADLIDPGEPSATDLKSVDGTLPAVRRSGANAQQKFQRHAYAAGAMQGGLIDYQNVGEPIVRNVWMDISDLGAVPHAEQEPYDPAWLDDGARWLDEVYHYVESDSVEAAPRDKDIFFCQAFCEFARACRGAGTREPEEEVVSDELSVAAALHREGLDLEREGKALKAAAASLLDHLEGSRVTIVGEGGRFRYSSTWVAPSDVSYTRKGYFRGDIKELR